MIANTLPPTSPFAVMVSDDGETEPEPESDSWPQPQSPSDSDVSVGKERGPGQAFSTIVSLPTPEPLPRPKPTWWSEAWEMLDGIQSEDMRIGYLTPMSGEEFRYKCESDVHAIDLCRTRSVIDPITGESRLATEQDDENRVVGGVMWSDEAITMSADYGKGSNPNGMHIHHLKRMLECVPNGRGLTLHTTSEFLVEEGERSREWVHAAGLEMLGTKCIVIGRIPLDTWRITGSS
jgi:hypothetical protein